MASDGYKITDKITDNYYITSARSRLLELYVNVRNVEYASLIKED